jgi:hypothetical protein
MGPEWVDTTWRGDHIDFANGLAVLWLDSTPCPDGCNNKRFAGGEYRTVRKTFGPGTFKVRMKAAKGSGLVTGFFVYAECQDHIGKICPEPTAREDERSSAETPPKCK